MLLNTVSHTPAIRILKHSTLLLRNEYVTGSKEKIAENITENFKVVYKWNKIA